MPVEPWVLVALVAGGFQTTRNALARSLAGRISPLLNSWSRFSFNLPFSALLVGGLAWREGVPALPPLFFAFCFGTAVVQLLGNVALVTAFERATFSRSIVLHKLEVVFTALVGAAFFAEAPTPLGWLGVLSCGLGVLWMNLVAGGDRGRWRRALHFDTGALLSLACALLLTLASFLLKEAIETFAAANSRVGSGRFEAAAHTLFHTTWIEVVTLSTAIAWRRAGEFREVGVHWRRMLAIGATGFAGSLGWFWAFSLTLVAYVKAVGQIEAVAAVALALLVWKERQALRELPGVSAVLLGILLVLWPRG